MTPLYDIMSAFPLFQRGGIPERKAKMAMALLGKHRQYHFAQILPRHFITSAARVGFSPTVATELMAEMAAGAERAIARVSAELPATFPSHIGEAIFSGLRRQATKIQAWCASEGVAHQGDDSAISV